MKWLSYLHIFKQPIVGEAMRARFLLGDRVRVLQWVPGEDSSTPHYIRGKSGVVEEIYVASTKSKHLTSDRLKTPAQQIYRMRFAASEVWPQSPGAPGDTLAIDISENRLERSAVNMP